jgi:hypothetical protein
MQVYLPIAEMSVPAESIFLVSAFVGFLSGIFGIGGGFLTTPFLIFTGIPPVIAVGDAGLAACRVEYSGRAWALGQGECRCENRLRDAGGRYCRIGRGHFDFPAFLKNSARSILRFPFFTSSCLDLSAC